MSAVFLDSNILVYAYSGDEKSERALRLLDEGYVIGVQSLNEFSHVAYRKLRMNWPAIARASDGFVAGAKKVLPTHHIDHRRSLTLAERHQLSIYDALMLAIALRAGCSTFYSEDMQHGFVVDDRMTIVNPFA